MRKAHANSSSDSRVTDQEATVERAITWLGGKVPSFTREALREDFRLQFNYPSQFVAFIDRWYKQGRARRLKRTVIATAATLWEIDDLVDALPIAQQRKVKVRFFEDPHGPISE